MSSFKKCSEQCLLLTEGCTFSLMVNAFEECLVQYLERFINLMKRLEKRKSAAHSWNILQQSLTLNQSCGDLLLNLEELDISYTKIAREFRKTEGATLCGTKFHIARPVDYITKLFELNSMTQLRNLICRPIEDKDIANFRSELPKVCINQGCLEIANSDQVYEPKDGFWEMDARQLKLFQSRSNRQTYEQRQIISRTGTW